MILLECTVGLRDGDRKKLQEQITAEIGQPVVILPSRCTYCKGELEGVEGEENDH